MEETKTKDDLENVSWSLLTGDNYLKISKYVIKKLGLYEAIVLGELSRKAHWFKIQNPKCDDWFWTTASQIEDEISLKEDLQRRIINNLVEFGFIEKERRGLPAKNYFKINHEKVIGLFLQNSPIRSGSEPNLGSATNGYNNKSNNNYNSSFFKKLKKEELSGEDTTCTSPKILKRKKTNPEENISKISENSENKKDRELSVGDSESSLMGRDLGKTEGKHILIKDTDNINRDLAETQGKNNNNKEKPQELIIPEKVKPFLAIWESNNFKLPGKNTKSYSDTICFLKKFIVGKLFTNTEIPDRPYTLPEFITSVERLKKSLSTDYYPLNKTYLQKITLKDFLFNAYSPVRSTFYSMLTDEPKPLKQQSQDFHPEITNLIISKYKKEVVNNLNYEPSPIDKNKFISAASQLNTFFEINNKLYPDLFNNVHRQVDCLIKSVITTVNDIEITPGFFCSNTMFNRRLPTYLNSQGLTRKENNNGNKGNFSIYR